VRFEKWQALGFDEVLSGDLETMKQRTRNYARRQLTWMRKIPSLSWIDRDGRSDSDLAGECISLLND